MGFSRQHVTQHRACGLEDHTIGKDRAGPAPEFTDTGPRATAGPFEADRRLVQGILAAMPDQLRECIRLEVGRRVKEDGG